MPKTANKRAQIRRSARVQRAHSTEVGQTVRRVPPARRKVRKRNFFQNYPWLTVLFVLAVFGVFVMVAHAQQLGPWTPPKPTPIVQATCDLKTHICTKAPVMTIDTSKVYTATIKTARGDIVITLDAKGAPNAVNNFVFLANQHWYDGTYFWRVEVPGKPSPLDGSTSQLSLVQGGSVKDDGTDDNTIPGYTINDDPVTGNYTPGTVAMANSGSANTGAAQFFIDIGDESQFFSKTYSIFGTVTSGMDVVKKLQPKDKIESITIAVTTPTSTPTAAATGTPAATATATSAG
jgi:peptidylprolyl isomerase